MLASVPATDSAPTRAGATPRQSVLERAPRRTLPSGIRVVTGLLRTTTPEHSGTLFLDTAAGNAGRVGPGGAATAVGHVVSGGRCGVVLRNWQISDGEATLPPQGHFAGAETSISTQ